MQRPSLDTLPPLSDPTGTGESPHSRFQTPAPQASPGLRGFLLAAIFKAEEPKRPLMADCVEKVGGSS